MSLKQIQGSLQHILESQNSMFKTIFPDSDLALNPDYAVAVERLVKTVQSGGRKSSRKSRKNKRKIYY